VVGTFHAAAEASFGYAVARPFLNKAADRLAVRTAVSDEARALVGRYFPGDYLLTPNGIELARYRDAAPSDLGPGRKILFLSRLERRKGLEVLIQACTRLRDLDPTLVVAGTGPVERTLRALARELRVPVRWLGRVPEDDKPGVFKSSDVYCAPALGGESFGIVLVEAMGSGVPVVCSDLPGFRAVGGGAATLVPPGDAGRLADALRAVLSDPDEARRMGKLGSRMAGLYDWERLVGHVEGIYDRALGVGTPA
jgi:phosphatidylinositol alpha-mannosyltransferase